MLSPSKLLSFSYGNYGSYGNCGIASYITNTITGHQSVICVNQGNINFTNFILSSLFTANCTDQGLHGQLTVASITNELE